MKKLRLKLAGLFSGFLVSLFLIYSRHGFHLMSGGGGRKIAGVLVFLLLAGFMLYLTNYFIRRSQLESLPVIETKAKVSEEQRLNDYISYFQSKRNLFMGPFENIKLDYIDMCLRMQQKDRNLRKLLSESFSPDDLTYKTYINTMDEVMKIFNNNLRAAQKRIEVFDYKEYKLDNNNPDSVDYITEVSELYSKNDEVISNVNTLLHELVDLDQISEVPLEKINRLIEQTQNYKKYKEE